MKLKIKKNLLLKNLNNLSSALSGKNLVPVYSAIKFDISKDDITLTATDGNISIEIKIPSKKDELEISEKGSILIAGRTLIEIINKLDQEDLKIEIIDDSKMLISTSNSQFELNGFDKKDFPKLDFTLKEKCILINSNELKTMSSQIAFATSNDESRPVLTGINFKITGNILECNATDSYRLAQKTIKLDENSIESSNFIIPKRNLQEFTKIIENDDDEKIKMFVETNKVTFSYKNIIFVSRLINGNYPNVINLFKNETPIEITVKKINIYNVIDRASIFATGVDKNGVLLNLKENSIEIKSSAEEIGKIEEKLEVKNIHKTKDFQIAFNSKFMMEALKSFSGEEITFFMSTPVQPIIIKNKEDESLIQLVQPLRI